MTEKTKFVTFGGQQFRLEQVSATYTRLHPVDPEWMLKYLTQCIEGKKQ